MNDGLLQRPLTGEPVALDLVNTEWVESGEQRDLLAMSGGLGEWLDAHGFSPGYDHPDIREALVDVRNALRACLETDDGSEQARKHLNEILLRGRVRLELDQTGPIQRFEVDSPWYPAWYAAYDYVQLRWTWPRWRVRACAHPQCILYFLDSTKNGTRRWCDMRTCGNRAKARRYKARVRSEYK